jgi:hypothetical protein
MESRLIFISLSILLTFCSCGPFHNPIKPGYPCGTRAHQCSSGGCCWRHQDCGGDVPNCRPGYCCTRDDWAPVPDSGADAGSSGLTRQWIP